MDIIRWIYYHIKIKTGIADTYRNEQFIDKNDTLYNFDYLMVSSNLNSTDKEKILENLIVLELVLLVKIHSYIEQFKINYKENFNIIKF